jgi:uncharacterized protein (TIGR03437 family)
LERARSAEWIAYSAASTGNRFATVTFTLDANSGSPRTAAVVIAGTAVQISQNGPSSINPGGIVNAASSAAGAVAPGSVATAYGTFLTSGTSTASALPLPYNLAGLAMGFDNGLGAPLYSATPGQVSFQVPWELFGQAQANLTVTVSGNTSLPQAIPIAPFAPGIFTMNAQGSGQGAILDLANRVVDSSSPATAGDAVIQIFCTGLGAVTNQPASGAPAVADPLSYTVAVPTVTIGGAPAAVLFSGLTPGTVGLYQVNAQVPATSAKGPAVPVVISIGGRTSNIVTIAVQ